RLSGMSYREGFMAISFLGGGLTSGSSAAIGAILRIDQESPAFLPAAGPGRQAADFASNSNGVPQRRGTLSRNHCKWRTKASPPCAAALRWMRGMLIQAGW